MVSTTSMDIFHMFFSLMFSVLMEHQCDATDNRVHFDRLLQKRHNFIFSNPLCNTMNISAVIEISFFKKKWQYQRRYHMIYMIIIST